MSSPQIPDAPIEPQVVADFCTGNTRIAAAAAPAGQVDRNTKHTFRFAAVLTRIISITEGWLQYLRMELLDNLHKEQRCRRLKERSDCFDIAMAEEKAPLRDWLQGLRLRQCYSVHHPLVQMVLFARNKFADTFACFKSNRRRNELTENESLPRFSRDNDLCGKLSWADHYQIIKRICLGLAYLHEKSSTSVIHLDLKPQNILLDDCSVPKISDFGISRLLDGSRNTAAPKVRAAGTHNSPSYVEFAVAAAAKGGAEIKIGSHVIRVPKYLSIHHPLVQMVLFARNKFADTFACCESMAPKSIFHLAKRLHASALSNWWKTDWNSARPKSESPKVGTFSDFSTGQSIVQRNELTENESHPSDTDASGAAWVAATAAPHHATGNRELLSGFIIEHDDQFVHAVDGDQFVHAVDGIPRKVLARGAVITDSVILPDVWFVPGLTENLVSISQLVELDHSVGFSCGECCVRSTDGKVVGKGHLQEGGLYVLDFLKVPLAI